MTTVPVSPEDLILNGRLPDGTQGHAVGSEAPAAEEVLEVIETDLSKDVNGDPVFADLVDQVEYDWKNLSSDRIKYKKNSDPAYAEALLKYLNRKDEPETPAASVAVVEPVIVPITTPPVVAPVEEEESTTDNRIRKVKGGWEATVDLGDGSGKQVFKAKLKDELFTKLLDAQTNATKKIRSQEQEKRILIANEPAEIDAGSTRLKPRNLTADEQWEIANNLGDPAKATKALDKYIEIRLGGPLDVVVEKITTHDNDLEFRRARNEAIAFIRETPEFYNTEENSVTLANYIEEQGWASTKRNLSKAFVILTDEDKLVKRPESISTPEEEETITPTREVAAVPAVIAPPVTQPVPVAVSVPTQPAGLPEGTRVRPGSSSTGMSPRSSSVRAGGATPATPVGLTAEEYNRMPSSSTKHKYRTDPGFRAQVDKLMAEGKI